MIVDIQISIFIFPSLHILRRISFWHKLCPLLATYFLNLVKHAVKGGVREAVNKGKGVYSNYSQQYS